MQLLGTCGLLIIIVITSLSLPIIQGMVWSGFICSARDHRGCCYNWIGEGAKEFGSSVAQKYDELKHKLTDEPSTTPKVPVAYDAPTEKVLLAPIGGPSTPIP
ncbi:GD24780 [Drosophila simulans]|uniref:GD24780 n=1 Tax=Drosophila simulans TaxID=7240 RepID=B4NU84_DROSI|nr:GD24780 [Drosophila simulans]